jgi:hypothetical protein
MVKVIMLNVIRLNVMVPIVVVLLLTVPSFKV